MKLNCVYILFIFHDDRYSAQPRDLVGNKETPWICCLPKPFSGWSWCLRLKGTRTTLKLSLFLNLVNQCYGLEKKCQYALKKIFLCINSMYILNINIIPKITTPDGESNLKHGHLVVKMLQEAMLKNSTYDHCY